MLNSVYSEKLKQLPQSEKRLTDAQISLLTAIKSKSRFEQLMEVLPENWENDYTINFYSDPQIVSNVFMNRKTHKISKLVQEKNILSIIVSDKHPATPGKYDEYLKRDNDYPIEDDKWRVYMGLTEFVRSSFHIDHKLIWVMEEREIDYHSNQKIEEVDFAYSINVYVPDDGILINAETIKLNGLV